MNQIQEKRMCPEGMGCTTRCLAWTEAAQRENERHIRSVALGSTFTSSTSRAQHSARKKQITEKAKRKEYQGECTKYVFSGQATHAISSDTPTPLQDPSE
jgi:hypothetical protein